ncbi:MAG: DUF2948 family protein [Parvularcula sp.]|jgi:hypothetical protein|nr:DUF2948 family protein [Parvularcula sp.]
MAKFEPVALMGADLDDLKTVSALLQDAVAKVGEMAFIPTDRRFAFVANRYVWEKAVRGAKGPGQRVRTGVHFDDVKAVRAKNVRMDAPSAVVDILSLEFDGDENGGVVTIHLAGGGAIALDVEAINVTMRDLSEPWRAVRKPDHEAG